MSVADCLSLPPWAASPEVVDHFREHGEDQQQVTDGQVHDQHVGWCPQRRRATEDTDHAVVAEHGNDSCQFKSQMIEMSYWSATMTYQER